LKIYRLLISIPLIIAFAGCTSVASPTELPATSPPVSNPSLNQPSNNPISPINTPDFSEITPPPAEANPFVKSAEEDLAKRLTIDVDQIHFLKITDIDWQDITQGCQSTPGQVLKKGAVNGYQIWLEANGKNYLYHIGLDNTIFLCPE
jgi:hypothetical protein